jgi:hypothetical protein
MEILPICGPFIKGENYPEISFRFSEMSYQVYLVTLHIPWHPDRLFPIPSDIVPGRTGAISPWVIAILCITAGLSGKNIGAGRPEFFFVPALM